ncbi:MAG: TlpA family protein disulfide reductase [Deferrisomatales bacterium]
MRGAALALGLLCLLAATPGRGELPPALRVGTSLPPLAGLDLEGNPADLGDLLGRTTVVLSFWSVHCLDCVRELDDLRTIQREFPADQVTVVAVNTDSGLPVSRVAGFIRRYGATRGDLGVRHLLDRDAAILDALGIREIPLLAVADRSGRVTSAMAGYSPGDRGRVAQALDEGRVALGAWSEGLRGRLRTVLRSTGAGGGRAVEWGSFRVEDGLALAGLYAGTGWLADPAGRRDRAREAARVEAVVAERLKVVLLGEALASVGVQLPPLSPPRTGSRPGSIEVPDGPLTADAAWGRLYRAVRFDELHRAEEASSAWVGDEYWAGLVGEVDLGALRARLEALGFPREPRRIRLEAVSDFDYKPRALLQLLRQSSYRLQMVQGEHLVYFGDPERLAGEIRALEGLPFKVFAEVLGPGELRLELF